MLRRWHVEKGNYSVTSRRQSRRERWERSKTIENKRQTQDIVNSELTSDINRRQTKPTTRIRKRWWWCCSCCWWLSQGEIRSLEGMSIIMLMFALFKRSKHSWDLLQHEVSSCKQRLSSSGLELQNVIWGRVAKPQPRNWNNAMHYAFVET